MQTAKTLIRLGWCPGWSESLLGIHAMLLVLSWGSSDTDSYWHSQKSTGNFKFWSFLGWRIADTGISGSTTLWDPSCCSEPKCLDRLVWANSVDLDHSPASFGHISSFTICHYLLMQIVGQTWLNLVTWTWGSWSEGQHDLYFTVQWFCLICMYIILWEHESVWPSVWPQNKYRSLWPIFHGPVILPCILKTIWYMNIIIMDYESVFTRRWPKNKCRSLWPIFHGPLILCYILKTIWFMNIILWDYGSVWPDIWPKNKYMSLIYAPREDSDQYGHPPSLIKVFAVHMKKAWGATHWAHRLIRVRWAHSRFVERTGWSESLCSQCDLNFMVQWFCLVSQKTIWLMNVIFSDIETGWPKLWPQNKYRLTWPLFHGVVILLNIFKIIWWMNIIVGIMDQCDTKIDLIKYM